MRKGIIIGVVITAFSTLIIYSFTRGEDKITPPQLASSTEKSIEPDVSSGSTIIVASFNIQNFGKTKMREQPAVVDTLISICLKYDIIAIQEISHKNGDTPNRFLDSLNRYYKNGYNMLISERSGLQADDLSSQEQYGFYFKKDKIEKLDEGLLYPDDEHDYFQREPYMAHFKAVEGDFDFVLITVHTAPAKSDNPKITLNEISALNEVIIWAKKHYMNEENFIITGDFNADCDYVKEEDLETLDIKRNYSWLIPNSEKTNLASGSDCTYDRIVITPESDNDYTAHWGVDRSFKSKEVSDHWPVWAEFWAGRPLK